MFKRRTPRSWARLAAETVWPQSGWRRAGSYVLHRLRRLPDSPQRIARGIFAGIFVSFMPFYGFHMLSGAVFALAVRGNVLAAIFGTLVGNPLTFPAIAWVALEAGYWMLGGDHSAPMSAVIDAFGAAATQLWHNLVALVHDRPTHWDNLHRFFHQVFLPYFVGGIPTGLVAGLIGYFLSLPVIVGYQKLRAKQTRERVERRLAERAAALARAEAEAAAAQTQSAATLQGPDVAAGPRPDATLPRADAAEAKR
ncbi:MAG: DUF2062 domain-containing protein [Gemmobacter sp.]